MSAPAQRPIIGPRDETDLSGRDPLMSRRAREYGQDAGAPYEERIFRLIG